MGQKLKISTIVTSIILLSGILGFGFSPDAFATHNDNGNGFAKGCDNQGVAKNNPHCNVEPPRTIATSPCNGDGSSDGDITAQELVDETGVLIGQVQNDILFATEGDSNSIIDEEDEYARLLQTVPYDTLC